MTGGILAQPSNSIILNVINININSCILKVNYKYLFYLVIFYIIIFLIPVNISWCIIYRVKYLICSSFLFIISSVCLIFFSFSPIKCYAWSLKSCVWVDQWMVIVFQNSFKIIWFASVFSEPDEHNNCVFWWPLVCWIFWDKRVGSITVPRQLISVFTLVF